MKISKKITPIGMMLKEKTKTKTLTLMVRSLINVFGINKNNNMYFQKKRTKQLRRSKAPKPTKAKVRRMFLKLLPF